MVYVYDEPRLMSTIQRFIPEQEDFQLLFLSTQVFDMRELNIQYPSHYSHPQQNSVMISSHPPSIGKHNFQQATTHMRISSTFYTQQKKITWRKGHSHGSGRQRSLTWHHYYASCHLIFLLSLCFVVQTYLMPSALCTPSRSMSAKESK